MNELPHDGEERYSNGSSGNSEKHNVEKAAVDLETVLQMLLEQARKQTEILESQFGKPENRNTLSCLRGLAQMQEFQCMNLQRQLRSPPASASEEPLGTLWDKILEGLTLIAGFLVIAAYPLVTSDLSVGSGSHPVHFSPETVRVFSAVSVGLFLMLILLCQLTGLLLHYNRQDVLHRAKKTPKAKRWSPRYALFWLNLLSLVLRQLLAVALLFFFLTIAAYIWTAGIVFIVGDCIFAITCFVSWYLEANDYGRKEDDAVHTAIQEVH